MLLIKIYEMGAMYTSGQTLSSNRQKRILSRSTALPLIILAGIVLSVPLTSDANAVDAYWDGINANTDNDSIQGGAGTWDAGTANWTDQTDSAPGVIWVAGNTAVFAGTAGTVTVSGVQEIGGLTFDTSGYTIAGGTLDINGTNATFDVGAGNSVTISSVIQDSGAGTVQKTGLGTIALSGTNTYTGLTTVSAGTLDNQGSLAGGVSVSLGAIFSNSGTVTGNISNSGTTTITAGTFNGGITNNAGATVNAAGAVNGVVSNAGTWNVTGDLTGNNTFTNSGTLTSDGTKSLSGFTSFANTGTIDIQDGDATDELTFVTAFSQSAAGTLEIDVASDGSSDTLMVTGTVALDGSLNVSSVDAEAAFQTAASGSGGQIEYTIIDNDLADAVTGNFSSVTDDLAFFSSAVSTTGGDGNDVLLTLTYETVDYAPIATNGNQAGTANALDDFDYSSTEGQGILTNFLGMTNAQAAQALEQMTGGGHVNAASQAGLTSSAFTNTVIANAAQAGGFGGAPSNGNGFEQVTSYAVEADADDRFDAFKTVAASEKSAREMATGYALWTQIAGGYHSIDADQNANELESYSGGVFVGTELVRIEGAFDVILGGSVGYSHTVFDNNTSGYDASADSFHAGVYGGIGAVGIDQAGLGLLGSISYSHHQYETERDILPGNLRADAEYAGYTFGGQVRARYGHEVSLAHADLVVAPVVGFDLFANETDAFLETGAGLLNLAGAGVSTTSAKSIVGASVSNSFQLGTIAVTSGITATWEHQLADTSGSQSMALTGSPTSFLTISAEEARDVFALATSTSFELTDRVQLNLSGRSTLSETSRSAESRLQLKLQL